LIPWQVSLHVTGETTMTGAAGQVFETPVGFQASGLDSGAMQSLLVAADLPGLATQDS
jgi:hypothetical protein